MNEINTFNEAKSRAEYLFYTKNPWGLSFEEVIDEHDVDISNYGDYSIHFEVCPPDSERWTVGVTYRKNFKESDDEDASEYEDEQS